MIPWHEETWCFPPEADAEFVARMEDLLDLYQLPYDPRDPVVGMDEMPKQLIAATRIPLPACEGHPVLYDYEYERTGVCNLFLFVEPFADGGRCSSATVGPRWTGPSACG